MTLWILLTLMCCVATAVLTVPFVRRFETDHDAGRQTELALYKQQLAEVEAEGSTGELSEDEVAAAKVEIGRRLLAAEKATTTHQVFSPFAQRMTIATVMLAIIGGGIAIYRQDGHPDIIAMAPVPAPQPVAAASSQPAASVTAAAPKATASGQSVGEVGSMIDQLAQRLATSPNDPKGWSMLGWSYFTTQRYAESANAYAKATELEPGNADYKASYAEALIQGGGGKVSVQAASLVDGSLLINAKNPKARFYKALAVEQAGKLEEALGLWSALLRDAPADAGWAGTVRTRLAELGKKTGNNVDNMLAVQTPTNLAKPAATMSEAEKNAMIDGMVANLEQRLETTPMDARGWEMLIRSYAVMGRGDDAASALARAKQVFSKAPVVQAQLSSMAESLGVTVAQQAQPSALPRIASPDPQQAAAIQALPAQDQKAMINSMVDRLAEKLNANPDDPEGWLKLIRSRLVLKQKDQAEAALKEAVTALAGNEAAIARVQSGANQLGVTTSN